MGKTKEDDQSRLDEAARAGWLYYVAGNTQEEIAAKLGISRQSAQRLVSLSMSAGLVKVRIDHPIAACLELAESLRQRFDLAHATVVPSDPSSSSTTLGIAEGCAAEMERRLERTDPLIMALGTGRSLKAAVERLPAMTCPQHRIVSLTGNIARDGSAWLYNVIYTMAETVQAPHFPMPLPVAVSTPEERHLMHEQKSVRSTLELARRADVAFVGIGTVGLEARLLWDGFITADDRAALIALGAVAEIVGWAFDAEGAILDCAYNERVASAPIPGTGTSEVIAVAMGAAKVAGIYAAIRGRLVNGVITDEATARAVLAK